MLTVKEEAGIYLTLDLFKSNLKNFPVKLFQPDQFDAEMNNRKEPILITAIIKSLLTCFIHPSKKSCDQYWVFLLKRLIDTYLEKFELDSNPLDVKSSELFSDLDNPFYNLKFNDWVKIFKNLTDLAVTESPDIKKEIDRQVKSGRSSKVQLKSVGADKVKGLKYWHAGSTRVYSQDKNDSWAIEASNLIELQSLADSSTPYLKNYFNRQVAQIKGHILMCENRDREEKERLYLLEQQRLEKIRLEEEERLAKEERQREIVAKKEQIRIEKEALMSKFKNRPKRAAKINYFLPEDELSDQETDLIYYDNNQENHLSNAEIPNVLADSEKLMGPPKGRLEPHEESPLF